MQFHMYSIRDAKADVFNTPYFCKTHGEAERNFTKLCSDPSSMVAAFPEDFDLYFVGVYDDQTGKVHPLDTPQHICKAVNILNPEAKRKAQLQMSGQTQQ